MIALLSPAKTLDYSPVETATTQPRALAKSEKLVKSLRRKSVASLQELMHISENLAKVNKDRYQSFSLPFTEENAKPAILAFKGDVYLGLEADTFEEADLDFAQASVRMLSGLYGLLRPRDLMQPYRLEMGTKLPTRKGKDLYAFWGNDITELINQDIAENEASLVINLASQEYFKSVKPELLNTPVLHIHFKENRNGQYKVIAFNAKKARGRMAHLLVKNRITDAEALKALDVNGYRYNDALSSEWEWYFTID
ncbi:MAG: peroxide stress protein YaaA [Bacteroidota bacterium]